MLNWDDPKTWQVLVVDDEPDNLELVVETLGFHGATLQSAQNGLIALETLKGFEPNLILLDLSMPELDGWELHRRIRADSKLAAVPVIAITAHAMVGDRERAIEAGFDGYISKPINVVTLLADIRKAYQDGKDVDGD